MRNAFCFAFLAVTCLAAPPSHIAFAASGAPTSQPADTPEERAKWMGRVQFWGNETTGEWSLRIKDAEVDKQRLFRLRQLWMYDRQAKRWVRLGTTMLASWMLPANKKKRDPDNPDTDGAQTLAVLPIDKDQVGIYFAKWTVDGVHGTTFCRIGPGLKNKADSLHKEPPEGHIWVVLPLDRDHAEPAVIPDPEVACRSRDKSPYAFMWHSRPRLWSAVRRN